MNRRFFPILSLLPVSLFIAPVETLSQDHSEELLLVAGEARLGIVDQLGADVRVSVSSDDLLFDVDHPLGRTGPEIFLLGPYAEDTILTISISRKPQSSAGEFAFRALEIFPNTAALDALRKLTLAGTLANADDESSVRAAASYYNTAHESKVLEVLGPQYLYYAKYLEAKVLQNLYELDSALSVVQQIPEHECGIPGFCYKGKLLEFQINSLQDQTNLLIENGGIDLVINSIEAVVQNHDSRGDLAAAKYYKGMALILGSEFSSGLLALNEALTVAAATDDKLLVGMIHGGLATHDFFSGKIVSALAHLQTSVANLKDGGDDRSITYALLNLNLVYRQLGEYGLAQKALLEALEFADSSFDRSLPREIYGSLGGLYLTMGDYNRAEQFTRLAIDYDLSINRNPIRTNDARNQLGEILRNTQRIDEAILEHLQVLEYYSSTHNTVELVKVNEQLALDYLEAGNIETAREYFENAYSRIESDIPEFRPDQRLVNLSRVLMQEERFSEAAELLMQARQSLDVELEYSESQIEILGMLIRAHSKLGHIREVELFGDQLVEFIFDIQNQLEFNRLGPAWSSKSNEFLKSYSDSLVKEHYSTGRIDFAEKALALVERSRSSNLIQQRIAIATGDSSGGEQELRRKLTELSRSRASLEIATDEYDRVSRDYYRVQELYQRQFVPSNYLSPVAGASISELQNKIPSQSIAVEFLCVPGSSCHAFSLDSTSLEVVELGDYETVLFLVDTVQTTLRSGRRDTLALQKLEELVFDKLSLEGKSEIFLVNDYPLNAIPFSALSVSDNDGGYVPAMERFAIANVPSLMSINMQFVPENYPIELAVLANPNFSEESSFTYSNPGNSSRGWVDELSPLPWSEVEAENLAELYSGEEVRVYTGEQANRRNLFAEETRNAKILHIASHAFFNESMSDLVGIALSGEKSGADLGGDFVTLADLQVAKFNTELVIISGCETGRGEYLAGEGNMSLARGFLGQGVSHVVSTLWPVSDRASADFMKLFHSALHIEGQSVRRALRTAQMKLLEIPQYRQPFYWAPYTLVSTSI